MADNSVSAIPYSTKGKLFAVPKPEQRKIEKRITGETVQLALFSEGHIDIRRLQGAAMGVRMAAVRSAKTQATYERDWRRYEGWAAAAGLAAEPLDAEVLCCWLLWEFEQGAALATLERRLAAVCSMGRERGGVPAMGPVRDLLRGLRRRAGSAQRRARALDVPALRSVCEQLQLMNAHATASERRRAARDRALIVLGFVFGLRRAELVGLVRESVELGPSGVTVHLRRSKTDPLGVGTTLAAAAGEVAATCPVEALRAWLDVRGEHTGSLWELRDSKAVVRILRARLTAAGFDVAGISGHSLRAGMITAALGAGAPDAVVMQRSRHKSRAAFGRYVRPATGEYEPLRGVV